MKKLPLLLAFLLIIFCSIDTKAQMGTKGFKGGFNSSLILVDGNDPFSSNFSSLQGFHAGIFFRTVPVEKVSLQVEILYNTKGAVKGIEDSFSSYRGEDIRLDYITVPLLARINFIDNRLGILIGPEINFLARVGDDGNLEGSGQDLRALYKDFDFTVALGLEFDITSGLLIGSRTTFGLTDIMSGDNATVTDGFGIPIIYTPVNGGANNFLTQAYVGFIF